MYHWTWTADRCQRLSPFLDAGEDGGRATPSLLLPVTSQASQKQTIPQKVRALFFGGLFDPRCSLSLFTLFLGNARAVEQAIRAAQTQQARENPHSRAVNEMERMLAEDQAAA